MPFILLAVLIVLLIIGPGIWVKAILAKHKTPREDLSGSGGELAEHLVERFELEGVKVQATHLGDHYNPSDKTINLSEDVYNGRSLTAVAVAAHEFGHAVQDAKNDGALKTRTTLVMLTQGIQKLAGIAIFILPVMFAVPGLAAFARPLFILIIASMFLSTLIHFVTLPVEFDASFSKALPILQQGNYLTGADLGIARKILLACALTYVSQALLSTLSLRNWIRLLRR